MRTGIGRPGATRASALASLVAAGVVALAALLVAPALLAQSAALPRASADRPDERTGSQVHAVYALPSDGADRGLDTNGTITASVSNWQAWLRGQTGGRGLNLDTAGGELDVTFVRLPGTDAQYAARGVFVRDAIERDLASAGLAAPGKLYLVYYDGSSTAACGGGAYPPSLPGTVGAVYLRATYGGGLLCYDPARSLAGLQIMDFAILHEALHTMGIVPACAPNHTRGGHVSDSPTDLMYAGDQPWRPATLDVGRNDYFEAPVGGCLDLAESPWFGATSDAAPTSPPSGGGGSGGTTGGGGAGPSAKVALRARVRGPGRLVSTPAGIACPGRCSASFPRGTAVSLRAVPKAKARVTTWTGACRGSRASCRVPLGAPRAVGVTFAR